MNISGSDFNTNSLQFYLWSVNKSEAHTEAETIFMDHKLVGECYISLNKINSELIQLVILTRDKCVKLTNVIGARR